ncbi:MAG: hypothetical protein LBS97_05985 [Treponema sp.]|nr:hypothetical protein [Treponema sp.]
MKNNWFAGAAFAASCFMFMSCGFEIPESIKVTGHPELHVPLGTYEGVGDLIEDNLTPAKIRELDGMDGMDIYNFRSSVIIDGETIDGKKVQTYLLRYPIAKQTLNLSEYMGDSSNFDTQSVEIPQRAIDAMTRFASINHAPPVYVADGGALYVLSGDVPDFSGDLINQTLWDTLVDEFEIDTSKASADAIPPLVEIGLGDMEKWMSNVVVNDIVNDKKSFISLTGGATEQSNLLLKVPQLGITVFDAGEVDGAKPNNLRFINATEEYTLLNNSSHAAYVASEKIQIYARLDKPLTKSKFEFDLGFEWKKADVKPGENGIFEDVVEGIDLSALTKALGGSIKFDTVHAYLYVDGLPDPAKGENHTVRLTAKQPGGPNTPLISDEADHDKGDALDKPNSLKEVKFPEIGGDYTGNVPPHSFDFDLADIINAGKTLTLDYEIIVAPVTIKSEDVDDDLIITADMLLLLPLQFTASGDTDSVITVKDKDGKSNTYIKLKIDALPEDAGDTDLLQRKDGEEGDSFSFSDFAGQITVKINKGLTSGLLLGLNPQAGQKKDAWSVTELSTGTQVLRLTSEDTKYPFIPEFSAVAPVVSGQAKFSIAPINPTDNFDVTVTVDGGAKFEFNQKL